MYKEEKRLLIITRCEQCPYYDTENTNSFWAKCKKAGFEVEEDIIPEYCPLPKPKEEDSKEG